MFKPNKAQCALLSEYERRSLEVIGKRLKLLYLGKKDGTRYWTVTNTENPTYGREVTLSELQEYI